MPGLPGQGFIIIIIIIIIIMSYRASMRVKPPRYLTNTFCLVQPLLATAQLFKPTLFHSFSTVCHLGATMEPIGLWTSSRLCPNSINAASAVTPPVSVLLFSVTIDLIHDTRHLCTPFRIDGIKKMSGGISGSEQKIKFANVRNCGLLCLFSQNKTTI